TTTGTVHGVATFTGCKIVPSQDGNIALKATESSDGLTALSSYFNVGGASKLVFTTQPAGAIAGNPIATEPVVQVEDAYGNLESGDNQSSISLTLTTGSGVVTNCGPLAVTGGVADFTGSGCEISQGGLGDVLTATDSTDSNIHVASQPFNVIGAATHL